MNITQNSSIMKLLDKIKFRNTGVTLTLVFICLYTISCGDYMKDIIFRTSDVKMIDEYILAKDTSMRYFLRVVDKAGYRGLLHAYGTNTCFIPNNSAMKSYANVLGVDSLQELPTSSLEMFLDFHIIRDTIPTANFIDGRLSQPTMLGKYLTTKTVQIGDQMPIIRVSEQANIIEKDIRAGNGIIHKIDNVLLPNPLTVGEIINQLPENYSLFKSIMLETGIIDSLTSTNVGKWYTALLISNEAYSTAGITNRDELINKLKLAQPDIADDNVKLLKLYAGYHILPKLAYVADLSVASSELTLANNQVITLRTNKDSLIVNEYRSLSKFEKGILINKSSEWTDYSCNNGVTIDLSGYIQPVKRGPEAVYWEITDQPEVKKLQEYRKIGSSVTFLPGELSELNFGGKNNPVIRYKVDAYSQNSQYVNGDYFEISTLRPSVMQWMEIKTPVLTEGIYYVWICWRRGGDNNKFKTTFRQEGKEDQVLPNVFDLGEYFAKANSPEVNLNNGMKQYNAKSINSVICSRNCGAIQVDYTGRHTLRIDALSGGSASAQFDMIQFIPVDQNQIWPKFDYSGKAIYPCTPCEQIYPFTESCSFYNSDPCQ